MQLKQSSAGVGDSAIRGNPQRVEWTRLIRADVKDKLARTGGFGLQIADNELLSEAPRPETCLALGGVAGVISVAKERLAADIDKLNQTAIPPV